MRIVEITSSSVLEGFRPEWERLWNQCSAAGPFQHPDWLLPWWKHVGGGELWAIAVLDDEGLAALAPFFIHREPRSGARQLTLLGNGISDQLDVLVADHAPGVAKSLFARVQSRSEHWDTSDFRDLPAGSRLLSQFHDGLGAVVSPDTPCPTLDLAGAREDLSGAAPAKLLANLRSGWRRAEALGDARFECASGTSLHASFDLLFRLHSLRWNSEGQTGILSHSAIQAFHREIGSLFAKRGWLRLYLFWIGSSVVAATYGFHLRGKSYFYIGGFDPKFEKLSPGALVIRHAISDAVRDGAGAFEFLRGAEAYKYRWGARDRPQYRVQVGAPLVSARTAHAEMRDELGRM